MPRGDGLKSGAIRRRSKQPYAPQYVPRKLADRLHDFEEEKRTPDEERMSHRPGSQNPRKS